MAVKLVSDEDIIRYVADGLTYDEIAERAGLAYASVAKKLYALRQRGLLEKRPHGGKRKKMPTQAQRKALNGKCEPKSMRHADIAIIDGRPVVPLSRLMAGR